MSKAFNEILEKYRREAFSERDKGGKFERLMKAYLQTDRKYSDRFKKVWLWHEFPGSKDLGGQDVGIDLVALEHSGEYWAIQCKFFQEGAIIDKPALDSFFTTSGRTFKNDELKTVGFSVRLWIDTTGREWGVNAEKAVQNQQIPLLKLHLHELRESNVDWQKLEQGITGRKAWEPRKDLYPHVITAVERTHDYFQDNERGKLIMACGTGKTLTSLKIAEKETDGKGLVLFLVPSIALMGQTLREWYNQADEPVKAICICSDAEVSRVKGKDSEDEVNDSPSELAEPASTRVEDVLRNFKKLKDEAQPGMTVVFSTYQSIQVVADAQQQLLRQGWPQFDLIICDEAHRTTGVTLSGHDESSFVKVHDADFIKGKRRLYMTATPRLYSDDARSKAAEHDAILCSMDDTATYGDIIYELSFSEAVQKKVLTDYKVLVLTLNETHITPAVQRMVEDNNHEIDTDDASKLIGCINALSKNVLGDNGVMKSVDPGLMRRAVAFCQRIEHRKGQNSSKATTAYLNELNEKYVGNLPESQQERMVRVSANHVDGAMGAAQRERMLSWLKEESDDPRECRILTNVRCLSEGVDVPALDAVIFLASRSSYIDVVQSVGRVMRKSEGKQYGYIIIPIVIPSDVEADKALDDNKRYKVVWQVLNALRSHDDRLLNELSKAELNRLDDGNRPPKGSTGSTGSDGPLAEDSRIMTLTIDNMEQASGADGTDTEAVRQMNDRARQMMLRFEELQGAVYAKMVEKVGDRKYWERWAQDVAQIAERYMGRLNRLIDQDEQHRKAFDNFMGGLHRNINPSITRQEAVEMLSQHMITRPVFDALFEGYSFVKNNAISHSMQQMLDLMDDRAFDKDTATLDKFYDSVRTTASGITTNAGRQKVVLELYDKFFKTAFPKLQKQLGIVYTPVEVVDFIIHSVDDVLRKEFGRGLSDENVHILDPFTGTGTFMTRLLQSGLIDKRDLARKYRRELHANEIVLLAYYIAAVNIENAFHDRLKAELYDEGNGEVAYESFEGICLTDTFQLGETDASERLITEMFPQNSERVKRQKKAPIRVIMGNPPYSIAQKSSNDNAQNQEYPILDKRVADTYTAKSSAILRRALYDPYIKAFRWSSDRLSKEGGIVAYVTNGKWLEAGSTDGFRKCLEEEFTAIYVFNLRGDQRTSAELSRREGGKIFGSGSRTPIAITLLVKNPGVKTDKARIHYHDIGDYLSRAQKLDIIRKTGSISNLDWTLLNPNNEGDWIDQRNSVFETFIPIEPNKKDKDKSQSFFTLNGPGVLSGRESWVYGFSKHQVENNMGNMIAFYESQRLALQHIIADSANNADVSDLIDNDETRISWTRSLKHDISRNVQHRFMEGCLQKVLLRPFVFQHLYFDRNFLESPGQTISYFPPTEHENRVICLSGAGSNKLNGIIMSTGMVDYNALEAGAKCFPLYCYEEVKVKKDKQGYFQGSLYDEEKKKEFTRRDGISDFILSLVRQQYGAKNIAKEDIFYYVYGFLHSPEYREAFANDLKKMLPRLPLVDSVKDFWAFSKAGKTLADLHVGYEQVPPNEEVTVTGEPSAKEKADAALYRVQKMKFPKKGQKDTIIFNGHITVSNIPAAAYDYVVNGKSAIEWVMERYQVTTDKKSGIKNNPNDWADEVDNPRYILDLLLRVIEVSVRSVALVKGLPKLQFDTETSADGAIAEHDMVVTTKGAAQVAAGTTGTVVHVYEDGAAYEVEFIVEGRNSVLTMEKGQVKKRD